MKRLLLAVAILANSMQPHLLVGQETPGFEQVAEALQKSVVTVRVTQIAKPAADEEPDPLKPRVTICSGILVGKGLVISPIYAGTDARIRITLPGGSQASADVRVIDEYSGLSLLELDQQATALLKLADEIPNVGAPVMSAAAWGTDKPVVSLGIVSGTDRTLSGVNYPPLLQCDVRTTETSSGAAVVDRDGKLIGVIVLAEQSDKRGGWTYAVPVRHVKRLMRSFDTKSDDDSVIILKRRRPEVGMVLDGGPDQIEVVRVEKNSPAEKAGIKKGDRILATDGVQVRSVYQAIRPVLSRQPGDVVRFLVAQRDAVRSIDVQLGGGDELPAAPFEDLDQYVQPKIQIEGLARGIFRARNAAGGVREVFAPDALAEADAKSDKNLSNQEKIELLDRALDSYRAVIVQMRDEIKRQEQERAASERLIKSLQAEIDRLKREADQ